MDLRFLGGILYIYINIQVGLVDLPPVLSGSKIEVFDNNESVCLVARIGQF